MLAQSEPAGLDFGLVGVNERRVRYINFTNPNPVPCTVLEYKGPSSSSASLSVTIDSVSDENNNSVDAARANFKQILQARESSWSRGGDLGWKLMPGHTISFKVTLMASKQEQVSEVVTLRCSCCSVTVIKIRVTNNVSDCRTDKETITTRLTYRSMKGELKLSPSALTFDS